MRSKLLTTHMESQRTSITTDTIKRCRELVAAVRLTSQRREDFRKTMGEGVVSGAYTGDQLELIRDMAIRWSSTFYMINRFLQLSEVCTLLHIRCKCQIFDRII
jgi:hypothetical protein